MSNSDVVVVGGGVIGCSIAYHLAREGASVTLVERDGIAAHASGAAAGMLAPISESTGEGAFFEFALSSLQRMPELAAELRDRAGVDPQYVPSGLTRVAFTETEAAHLQAQARRLSAYGLEWMDHASAREREPHITAQGFGALWSPLEGHVYSPYLTRAYAQAAASHGVRIRTGVVAQGLISNGDRILGLRTDRGDLGAGTVVLCTGAWTGLCAPWVRMEFPVEPVRGQILALEQPRPSFRSILWSNEIYLVSKLDGTVIAGATEERAGFDCRTTASALTRLLTAAQRLAPALSECAFVRAWAGLRPDTPDHLPMIGPVPGLNGLVLAAGHYRNGVLLSPATGELVAGWILHGAYPMAARDFLPQRFLRPRG